MMPAFVTTHPSGIVQGDLKKYTDSLNPSKSTKPAIFHDFVTLLCSSLKSIHKDVCLKRATLFYIDRSKSLFPKGR